MEVNELSRNAMGGTELMLMQLHNKIEVPLISQFQIIPSRVRELDDKKYRILWLHDLPGDPEAAKALEKGGWSKYHRIVCVSHWQAQRYIEAYGIPWSKIFVLHNAIVPIEKHEKPKDRINLIYFSTPHRGLNILAAVFGKLAEKYDDVHLDVYSSFNLYGWGERDEAFKDLFDHLGTMDRVTNHGAVPNAEIREALKKAHIFAYPSTWPETSCICLMEAMSAGLYCVHPNYGALPETAANWTHMYGFQEDPIEHANVFYHAVDQVIQQMRQDMPDTRLAGQKSYADLFYSWDLRALEWTDLLNSILGEPISLDQTEMFVYKTM